MSTLVLPSWVVPDFDAVRECERVSVRRLGLGPRAVTARDAGVAAALAWLTIGEVSPLTHRAVPGTHHSDGSWTPGASWELARAESWVALCVAAGAPAPTADNWRRLGVEPAPAAVDDAEFAYGAWRTLAWLLGVREDFPDLHRLAPGRGHPARPAAPLRATADGAGRGVAGGRAGGPGSGSGGRSALLGTRAGAGRRHGVSADPRAGLSVRGPARRRRPAR